MQTHPAVKVVGGIAALAPLVYLAAYRPWQLRWGATAHECAELLPGDEIVPRPQWSATRAVPIAADPEDVWPWLMQMGAGDRAGWYSYDWIDNGGMPSATEIHPEWRLEVGDDARMTAGSSGAFRVEVTDPGRSIVFANRERDGTVTAVFVVRSTVPGSCRLVHRVRFRVRPTVATLIWARSRSTQDPDHHQISTYASP